MDLYGEISLRKWGDFISQASERPQMFKIFQGFRLLPMPSLKRLSKKALREAKKNKCLDFFYFRENDYNSAKNAKILARSNLNSFVNFDSLTTDDGALESSHQGKFMLGLLPGGRDNYKNIMLVQGK